MLHSTEQRTRQVVFPLDSEIKSAALNQGYQVMSGEADGWLHYRSPTVPGEIAIGAVSAAGPWFLSVEHAGVARELGSEPASPAALGYSGAFVFAERGQLCDAIARCWQLSHSLPTLPLEKFKKQVAELGETERDALIKQRIGQDIFRDALMVYWRETCPITGIGDHELLRASHVIPWARCEEDSERLNVHNGLLLAAHWDAAFDSGLITFDREGAVIVSPHLSLVARQCLDIAGAPRIFMPNETVDRMTWHRDNIFQKT